MDVGAWLRDLGLEQYAHTFQENQVDAQILPKLTAEDLKDLGVAAVGHRRLLLEAIARLGNDVPLAAQTTTQEPATEPSETMAPEAERRQLTVLFCDLIGSTELSARLDPEEMREVIRSYQDACAGVVTRFEAFVAKFMGDGVLAYFGYPRAHEDEAERAVRCGLALTETVGKLQTCAQQPLAVRIGIATGLVVVGDLVGAGASQEQAVAGEAPNLAARLQKLAEPNTVVIAQRTRQLVGGLFELEDLGSRTLKGFARAERAWRVVGLSTAESRFEAMHAAGVTPLVGREHELALLLDRFDLASGGEGQVVLLSGEAGIGKSRITRSLTERLADEPHTRLRYYCSPYHTNSALQPVIEQLERAAGFMAGDTAAAKLSKLEAILGQATEDVSEVAPLFAALLAIPTAERYSPLNLTPQAQKVRTFEALIDQLVGLAAQQPVLDILEDAHWIDPTSAELFGLVIDRIQRLPVLLLITFRPEFSPPWAGHAHVTSLTLSRLGKRQGAAMVTRLTGARSLPPEVRDQILHKTDGVPLFVEELTKTVLESGLLTDAGDRFELRGPLPPFAIPATLYDSLLERLDRLAPVKEVAQIGAVIGREFAHELIDAIAQMPEDKLRDALDQLVAAELVFRRGGPSAATYSFKHALVQDAAYQSLLKSRRRQLHARIAEVLRQRFPDTVSTQPELLAHHCTEAGLLDEAIEYWRLAGERAARRAASLEAIRHFRRALDLLEAEPEGRERAATELKVLIQLGPALILAKGWAATEVGEIYQRASELARGLESSAELVPPLVGTWLFYQGRAQFDAADATTDELFRVARALDDPNLLLQAHHAAWPIPMLRGAFRTANEHVAQGLCLYDFERHKHDAFVYMGHDPGVCAHALGAGIVWALGFPERGDRHAQDALQLARRLEHAPTLAVALWFIASAAATRGDSAAALPVAEELVKLSEEQQLVQTRASALVIGGWAMAQSGQAKEGLNQLRAGFSEWREAGFRNYLPPFSCLLAESYLSARRYAEALEELGQALGYAEQTGERWWEARIYRTRGQLLLHAKSRGRESAEESFQTAILIARSQDATSLELQAATALACLWSEQGRGAEAHVLLAPIYGRFTEGFDTPDLKEASVLLDELR